MSQAVLPEKASFKIKRLKDGMADFVYSESVPKEYAPMMRNTVAASRGLFPDGLKLVLSKDGCTVRVAGRTSYQIAASMIVTEFLAWSALFQMNLADLFLSSMYGAVARVAPGSVALGVVPPKNGKLHQRPPAGPAPPVRGTVPPPSRRSKFH